MQENLIPGDLDACVRRALTEDIGAGDLSAALIAPQQNGQARIISREAGVLCGVPYVESVFRQLPGPTRIHWQVSEGEVISANQTLCELHGPSRSLLSGERTALNFLQLLSGIASQTRQWLDLIAGTQTRLLDTRKTLPGLRLAQKYAVRVGGGHNHRLGLYDGILIKENHIIAAGGIQAAVNKARTLAPLLTRVEVEVENLDQLEQALQAGADIIMLDNFDLDTLRQAVTWVAGRVPLEASGNIGQHNIRAIAETGVDYLSVGKITRDIQSLDLSMRFF